jgi:death on curing protein
MHLPALESALAQPQMTFGGEELYPTLVDKAAVFGYALIKNHPFLDGNKRTGHAAMEVFLVLNGYEIRATVDEQEHVILQVAASEIDREGCTAWLRTHVVAKEGVQLIAEPGCAADALQRSLRSRFQARLTPGVGRTFQEGWRSGWRKSPWSRATIPAPVSRGSRL